MEVALQKRVRWWLRILQWMNRAWTKSLGLEWWVEGLRGRRVGTGDRGHVPEMG